MVRLVKGAYWDSEIKRAQVDGLDGFPVFTRKVHTDVCLSRLRAQAARRAATRSIRNSPPTTRRRSPPFYAMAGPDFYRGQYEFQCLHGMGEPLYEEVVGARQARPPVPHLCAGRHARDAARLSGAPAAGKRRQHLVRQPHRRRERADRRAGRRSGRGRAARSSRSARRIAQIAAAARSVRRRSARIRAGSISPTSSVWPGSPTRSTHSAGDWRGAPVRRRDAERGRREPVRNPADHARHRRPRRRRARRRDRRRRSAAATRRAGLGRDRRRASAPRCLRRAADLLEARIDRA